MPPATPAAEPSSEGAAVDASDSDQSNPSNDAVGTTPPNDTAATLPTSPAATAPPSVEPSSITGAAAPRGPPNVTASAGGTVVSTDGGVSLDFSATAVAADLTVTVTSTTTPAPAGVTLASSVYDLDAVDVDGNAVHQFAQPVQLTIHYDPAAVGANPTILYIAPDGTATALATVLDAVAHTATAAISHFSTFAVGASAQDAHVVGTITDAGRNLLNGVAVTGEVRDATGAVVSAIGTATTGPDGRYDLVVDSTAFPPGATLAVVPGDVAHATVPAAVTLAPPAAGSSVTQDFVYATTNDWFDHAQVHPAVGRDLDGQHHRLDDGAGRARPPLERVDLVPVDGRSGWRIARRHRRQRAGRERCPVQGGVAPDARAHLRRRRRRRRVDCRSKHLRERYELRRRRRHDLLPQARRRLLRPDGVSRPQRAVRRAAGERRLRQPDHAHRRRREHSGLDRRRDVETGERDQNRRSVWFAWTPTATGLAAFTTTECCEGYIFVYTGTSLGSLSRLSSWDTNAQFRATAGVTYRIKVDTWPPWQGTLAWQLFGNAPNDDFGAPTTLAGNAGSQLVSTVGATTDAADPNAVAQSVWIAWTPTTSGLGVISLDRCCAELRAFTGSSLGALTEVVASSGNQVQFAAQAGTTYRLELGNAGEFGSRLSWLVATKPANDDFASAQNLGTDAGTVAFSTFAATNDPNEPDVYNASVWFTWTPTASGGAAFDLGPCCSAYAFIYEGNAIDA